MRIHELASELKTTPKELLRLASELDLESRTALSSLDSDDVALLRKNYRRPALTTAADEEVRRRARVERKGAIVREQAEASRAKNAEEIHVAQKRARSLEAKAKEVAPEKPAAGTKDDSPPSLTDISVSANLVASTVADAKDAPPPQPAGESAPVETAVPPIAEADTDVPKAPPVPTSHQPLPSAPPGGAASAKKRTPRPFHPDDDDDLNIVAPGFKRTAAPVDTFKNSKKGRDEAPAGRGGDRRAPFGGKGKDAFGGKGKDSFGGASRRPGAGAFGKPPVVADPAALENKTVSLHGAVIVKDLATKLGARPNVIIAELMKMGVLAAINQAIDVTTATKIAIAHGFTVEADARPRRKTENKVVIRRVDADDDIPEDRVEDMKPRPPVVTFLGHVDHGKTSLMDAIRKTSVASGEAGGITQHIGAYTVDVNGQPITFLDTPGHAAFSAMRARGANLTDIAVIIIAADDGIMPQTREAIKHAKTADVTLMIAINKCDLPQARPERVMQQLQGENLTPEEWGGDTICCKVSAHTGDGVDRLLDMILLQAEILELRAHPNRRANGTVIEAQMEPGRGPTASVLITGGTLNVGDSVLCGEYYGRIRGIMTAQGTLVKSSGPSTAVQIMGLSGVPEAGAEFRVMPNDKRAKQLAEEYSEKKKLEELEVNQARSAEDIFKKMHESEKLELRIILRADVQGSIEAIEEAIRGITSNKVGCDVIQSGTGSITANDVQRAASGSAIILGFHVSPEPGVTSEARHHGARIKTFRIIYELLDFIKQEMLALLPAEYKEVVRGHALVKQVFALNKKGNVAGCAVTDGQMVVSGKMRIIRARQIIHTGSVASLRHFQDEVKDVAAGQECGICLANYEDYREGDILECFVLEEMPKTL